MKNRFNAIDLFAGAGGLSLGLHRANFNVVMANEIDKIFCQTYRKNHPETYLIEADIHSIDFLKELEKINFSKKIHLVCGGPPCQGFSTVGKKEKSDSRNSLFLQFLKTVKNLNPDFIFFENVSGFKRMYQGEMFNTLISELKKENYIAHCKIINALHFGLPQHRERTIVIAHKREFQFNFPNENYSTENARTLYDAISDLSNIDSNESSERYKCTPENEYQKELRNGSKILSDHHSPNHGEKLLKMISYVKEGGSVFDIPEKLRPKKYFSNTYSRLKWDEPTPTITRNFGTPSSSRCIHPEFNRGLTTREGARIQGFPDNYFFAGSRSQKNLQIGNAVPPVLSYEIGEEIFKSLNLVYEKKKQEPNIRTLKTKV